MYFCIYFSVFVFVALLANKDEHNRQLNIMKIAYNAYWFFCAIAFDYCVFFDFSFSCISFLMLSFLMNKRCIINAFNIWSFITIPLSFALRFPLIWLFRLVEPPLAVEVSLLMRPQSGTACQKQSGTDKLLKVKLGEIYPRAERNK